MKCVMLICTQIIVTHSGNHPTPGIKEVHIELIKQYLS